MEETIVEDKKFCECGCGLEVKKIRRFQRSHRPTFQRGSKNPSWRGGRITNPSGYILIKKWEHRFANPNGYIFEHRLVWEEYNKACLLPWGVVHHKNEIKSDNRIKNLHAMMKAKHVSLHFTKDMTDRFCFLCNGTTTSLNKRGRPKWVRHQITKQEWVCNRCAMEIYHKLEKSKKKIFDLIGWHMAHEPLGSRL